MPRSSSPVPYLIIAAALIVGAMLVSNRLRPADRKVAGNVPPSGEPSSAALPGKIRTAQAEPWAADPGEKSSLNTGALIARLRACLAETDPEIRARLEQELESLLTNANAADILRALPPDLLTSAFAAAAIRHWVDADRRSAAGWMASQTGLTEPEQTSVIYGWGTQDKTALDNYLTNLPAGDWKQSAMKYAANDALAGGSPQDAIDLLVQMDRTTTRDDLLKWSATAWAQSNSAAALQWADQLQDPAQKEAALGAVAVGMAWSDPPAAGRLVAQSVAPGAVQDQSALSVASIWSQSDPRAASDWVASFPEGDLRQSVLETLIQRWATQDAGAAKQWVNGLPDGPVKDQAARFMAAAAVNLHTEDTVQAVSSP